MAAWRMNWWTSTWPSCRALRPLPTACPASLASIGGRAPWRSPAAAGAQHVAPGARQRRNPVDAAKNGRSGDAERTNKCHGPPSITNALTIDVEDYFQVSAFAPHIDRSTWDSVNAGSSAMSGRILDMLAERQTRATFFTLGWIAERYPRLVRRIVDEGHELASHGYGHERASDLTEAAPFCRTSPAPRRSWRMCAASKCLVTARRVSRSAQAICGRSTACCRPDTATAPASIRLRTTTTACRTPRATRMKSGQACWKFRSRPCACSIATFRPAAAVISGCCHMPCRAGCWAVSTGSMASPASSTSTRGRSMPDQPRIDGHQQQDAVPPLRQHPPDGGAPGATCCDDFTVGPDGPDLPPTAVPPGCSVAAAA
jgi:hypothetical protein